ncbi:MAG TPA: metallopeptidase family protein [Mycobacteriales bacterium]|nr:metallopeptidase family protein [Mycobacteriales bacterium]
MSRSRAPRRRDRHGRGLRRPLLPRRAEVGDLHVALPAARTPGDRFDDLVHDARERLEARWARELEHVDWAVVDVPGLPRDPSSLAADPDVVVDETAGGAVPLGRLRPGGVDARGRSRAPVVVVYRRPLEARAGSRAELGELVHDVVVDVVARLLGVDPDVVDPQDDEG